MGKRLKEDHPALKKLDAVFEELERSGVSFEIQGGPLSVKIDGKSYWILDNESTDYWSPQIYELPPMLEWKLWIDESEKIEEEK